MFWKAPKEKKDIQHPMTRLSEIMSESLKRQIEREDEMLLRTHRRRDKCQKLHPEGSTFDHIGKQMLVVSYRVVNSMTFEIVTNYLNTAGEIREHVFRSSEYPVKGWPLDSTDGELVSKETIATNSTEV